MLRKSDLTLLPYYNIDRNHNPEFTLLEAYAAFWDYNDMMHFVELLYARLALKLYNKTKVPALHPDTGR